MTAIIEKPTKQDIQAKWHDYVENRDQKVRDSLIETYLPLLISISKRVHHKLRGHVDLDDLTSSGTLGLMAAIDTFDPSRGIAFETFCTYRIRGAIFDEVRAMDWVPRLVRTRARLLADAEQALAKQAGCNPTDLELAAYLNIAPDAVRNMRRDDRKAVVVSLTGMTSRFRDNDMGDRELDALSDHGANDVSRQVLAEEFEELTTAGLSKAELLIVKMYYFEEMTMAQVGKALDLSESRVSQMHTAILARLRANPANRNAKRVSPNLSNSMRMTLRPAPMVHARERLVA